MCAEIPTADHNALTLGEVSEKDERCFARAVELMRQLEDMGRKQCGNRVAMFGLWRQPKALILCELRLRLFRQPFLALSLDEWLLQYFGHLANFYVLPRDIRDPPRPQRQPSYRAELLATPMPPAFARCELACNAAA